MNIYINIAEEPTANLTQSQEDLTAGSLQTFFYGDKIPLKIYLHDNGTPPPWLSTAEIKIAFGDLQSQNPYIEAVTTFNGTFYDITLDLTGADFEVATRNQESVAATFEIQAIYADQTTETLTQLDTTLNNAFLVAEEVTLEAPADPTILEIGILPVPEDPDLVIVESTPTDPDQVAAVNTDSLPKDPDQITTGILPEAPSEITAITNPADPGDIITAILPEAPDQVAVTSTPTDPDQVNAITNPADPDQVQAGSLPEAPDQVTASHDLTNYTGDFTPVCIGEDIAFWFDGAKTETIKTDSANRVNTWLDRSGNANTASQADQDRQPLYDAVSNSINFDGIDDFLSFNVDTSLFDTDFTFPTTNTTYNAPFRKIRVLNSWHPHLSTGSDYDLEQVQITNGVLSNFKLGNTTAGSQWVQLGQGRGIDWEVLADEAATLFDGGNIFIVGEWQDNGSNYSGDLLISNTAGNVFFEMYSRKINSYQRYHYNSIFTDDPGNPINGFSRVYNLDTDKKLFAYQFKYESSLNAEDGYIRLRKDGQQQTNSNTGGGSYENTLPGKGEGQSYAFAGSKNSFLGFSRNYYGKLKINEVIALKTEADTATIEKIEYYLATKWAINLPNLHTYKVTQPIGCFHGDPCFETQRMRWCDNDGNPQEAQVSTAGAPNTWHSEEHNGYIYTLPTFKSSDPTKLTISLIKTEIVNDKLFADYAASFYVGTSSTPTPRYYTVQFRVRAESCVIPSLAILFGDSTYNDLFGCLSENPIL